MATTDHYKTLQVDPRADHTVIHAAYFALAKKYSGDDKKMKQINAAKSVLLDEEDARKKYDKDRTPKGKIIGDYRIIEKLAEGGFGTTYKAEHIKLGMPVCIKHALNVGPTDEKILLDEARSMWDLRHWGIPAIRDILKMPDDSLSLVMSYVPGPTLTQLIEDYPTGLDSETVAWIAERVLNILKYLHMHGVVHGDVKPQNIIVQEDSHNVVLVDYGLSSVKPTKTSGSKGYTPFFAAPEQMEKRPPIPQSDLYGLGMTMVFALGGDVEFVKVPADTTENLIAFIKRLIKRDPLSRPKVWVKEDLCDTIKQIRMSDFNRTSSGMKPIKK